MRTRTWHGAFSMTQVSAVLALAGAGLYAGSMVMAADPGTQPGFRCAIHPSETVCLVCDDCSYKNDELHCGVIIGGINCLGDHQALCTVTATGWTAECVSQS